jgi:hypothetical protein
MGSFKLRGKEKEIELYGVRERIHIVTRELEG